MSAGAVLAQVCETATGWPEAAVAIVLIIAAAACFAVFIWAVLR